MATSYANWGGQGNRTALIIGSSSGIAAGGCFPGAANLAPLLDGSYASGSCTTSAAWGNTNTAVVLKFDFRAGNRMIIDEFTWRQNVAAAHGTWNFAGSNDDIAYTDLTTGITLGSSAVTAYPFTNTTGYRYYKLYQVSGTTSATPWLEEIEFKISQVSGLGYDDVGGRGNRASLIVGSYSGITGGTGSNYAAPLLDGSFVNGSTASAWGATNTAAVLGFDFGAGNAKVISEFLWYQDVNATHGTWSFAGSNDGSAYTDLATGITLGVTSGYGQAAFPFTNTTAYRYYKLYQTAGTTSANSWNREIEFKIGASANGGGATGGWNQSDKTTNIVLSNSNLTASNSVNANDGVRGVTMHTSGKWVATFTGIVLDDSIDYIGVADPAQALGVASGGTNCIVATKAGYLYSPANNGGFALPTASGAANNDPTGHTVDFAVDFTNGNYWVRVDNGLWNGHNYSNADPATNTNGYPIGGTITTAGLTPVCRLTKSTATTPTVTLATTTNLPAGFSPWDGTPVTGITGTWASTETADSFAASGRAGYTWPNGSWTSTEAADTFAARGSPSAPPVVGDLYATEAADTFAAQGYQSVVGSMSVRESPDTFSAYGSQPITGRMAAVEAADTMAATGLGRGENGAWISTESADVFAATGRTPISGTFTATENADRFRAFGAGVTQARKRRTFFVT